MSKRPKSKVRSRGHRKPAAKVETNGRVITRHGPVLTVESDEGGTVACIRRGKRGKGAVVGDRVHFITGIDSTMADAAIIEVGDRRSALVRADALRRRAQVLAANIDTVFIVVALEPPMRAGLIDRYLVAAHAQGMKAQVIYNKLDLVNADVEAAEVLAEIKEELAPYPALGHAVHYVSAEDGYGLEDLREALNGQCSIFVGHSGVGKTSLLNALDPGLGERVGELSCASGRGQHTTSDSALFILPGGGEVIDSPGVRAFGLWGIGPEEVRLHFPELKALAPSCKFSDCRHLVEPGCAVLAALDAGELSEARYDSYLRIREGLLDDSVGSNNEFCAW